MALFNCYYTSCEVIRRYHDFEVWRVYWPWLVGNEVISLASLHNAEHRSAKWEQGAHVRAQERASSCRQGKVRQHDVAESIAIGAMVFGYCRNRKSPAPRGTARKKAWMSNPICEVLASIPPHPAKCRRTWLPSTVNGRGEFQRNNLHFGLIGNLPRQYCSSTKPPSAPPRCAKCATPAWVPVTPRNSSKSM